MRKTSILGIALALAALASGQVLSSPSSQEPDIRHIMQRKLDNAHALLEGLMTEDYETLEDSAGALRALSEEAGWFVLSTAEYMERSASFRRAVAEIEQSAKDKDLDGAALGYVDMTLQCVRCHEFLRGTRRAAR